VLAANNSPDDWDEVAWEYGYRYFTVPSTDLLGELLPDLAVLQTQIAFAPSDLIRARLARSAATVAALYAKASTHLGHSAEARHAWRLAMQLADSSADDTIRAWVHSQSIIAALYLHRPPAVIDRMLERATPVRDGQVSSGLVQLLQGIAQLHAAAGRRHEALTALREATSTFDRLPTAAVHDTSVYSCPAFRARHTEAFVLARVGSFQDADHAITEALQLYPADGTGRGVVIARAPLELHRALALVRDGDLSPGVTHASTVLATAPAMAHGTFVHSVARAVLDMVPPSHRAIPTVQEYERSLSQLPHSSGN
jgi:hypothetical protein